MKFYEIGLFMLVLYMVGGFLMAFAPSMGLEKIIYTNDASIVNETQEFETVTKDVGSGQQLLATNPLAYAFGWFYTLLVDRAKSLFSSAFPILRYVAWIPFYMQAIGIPWEVAWAVYLIIMTIMGVGFIQFLFGRDVEK